ncbi:hypothetical protein TKK_0001090 [Trichogramma kaykai]
MRRGRGGKIDKKGWEPQAREGVIKQRREALGKLGLSNKYIEMARRQGRKVEEGIETIGRHYEAANRGKSLRR